MEQPKKFNNYLNNFCNNFLTKELLVCYFVVEWREL